MINEDIWKLVLLTYEKDAKLQYIVLLQHSLCKSSKVNELCPYYY